MKKKQKLSRRELIALLSNGKKVKPVKSTKAMIELPGEVMEEMHAIAAGYGLSPAAYIGQFITDMWPETRDFWLRDAKII